MRTCLILLTASFVVAQPDVARWEKEARNITITRDDWGIAHVHGKTDADAVFGMIYAQAEDDFNRVEMNYVTYLGRAAEAEGESKIYQDLRNKIFVDPVELEKLYAASPEWLRKLMAAWADGLNFYLYKHPNVHPKVITHFEPWMPLAFSEGSIGGDTERVNLRQLESFYGGSPGAGAAEDNADPEPRGSSGVDAVNEYLETVSKKGGQYFYKYGSEERPMRAREITVRYRTPSGMAEKKFTAYYSHHGPIVRQQDGKWVAFRIMQEPVKA